MATKKFSQNVLDWVEQEQGKHFCQCGCGHVLKITVHHKRNGISRFTHGHNPSSKPKPRLTEMDFWNRVDKKGPDDCWLWMDSMSTTGYGRFYYEGKLVKAPRLSFFYTRGH